jgi:hypothetical protein
MHNRRHWLAASFTNEVTKQKQAGVCSCWRKISSNTAATTRIVPSGNRDWRLAMLRFRRETSVQRTAQKPI